METSYYIVFVYGLMCIEYLLFPTCFPKAFYAEIEGTFPALYEHKWKNWWSIIAEWNLKLCIIMVIPALGKHVTFVVWLQCISRVKRCLHATHLSEHA